MASIAISLISTYFIAAQELSVEKTSPTSSVTYAEEVINYDYKITNTGDVKLTKIKIKDDKVDDQPKLPAKELKPGEFSTTSAVYTVTQEAVSYTHLTMPTTPYV
jgi:hypothetical protein